MSAPTHEYPYPPPQQQQHAPSSKGLGIAAMVVGIVAIVLSFIPVIAGVSFILGPIAVVLGTIAFVKRRGRGQGIAGVITGALAVLIAIIGFALFGAFMTAVDDEMQSTEGSDTAEADTSEEAEAAVAEEEAAEAEEESEAAQAQEEEGAEPTPAEDAGDEGSRENPLPIGETVSNEDWEVTINSVTLNADDQIAAENEFSDPAPEGSSYALINMTATYLGDESEVPLLGTEVAYVSGSGETVSAFDQLVIAPDEFDSATELYNGGTEEGNVALAVPEGDEDGALRVRLGFVDTEDHFFAVQ